MPVVCCHWVAHNCQVVVAPAHLHQLCCEIFGFDLKVSAVSASGQYWFVDNYLLCYIMQADYQVKTGDAV